MGRCTRGVLALVLISAYIMLSCGAACPEVLLTQSRLKAICSDSVAGSAIGCTIYWLCNDPATKPVLWAPLCETSRILGSLCSDDNYIAGSIQECGSVAAECWRPFQVHSTAAARKAAYGACADMKGGYMAGCKDCTADTPEGCPDPMMSLSQGCVDMDMGQCAAWRSFCRVDAAPMGNAAGLLCLSPSRAAKLNAPPSPPAPSEPVPMHGSPSPGDVPTCVSAPSAPSCKDYQYPPKLVEADLDSLCKAMPYMPGCSVRMQCRLGTVHGAYCAPFAVLASTCADMGRMAGCRRYNSLCNATTSVVEQCKGAAIQGLPTTTAAWDAVNAICDSAEGSALPQCADCSPLECADPLSSLAKACAAQPNQPSCATLKAMCAGAAAWPHAKAGSGSSFTAYCAAPATGSSGGGGGGGGSTAVNGTTTVGPPPPARLAPNATDVPACVANSSSPTCKDYQYPLALIEEDLTNLCIKMTYMPGCSVRSACMAGSVRGAYCAPFALLATICADMPWMAGCARYNSLCNATKTVVEQCKGAAIQGLRPTKDTKEAVLAICDSAQAQDPMPMPCTMCTALECPNPLAALSKLCASQPAQAACVKFVGMCAAAMAWPPARADNSSSFATFCPAPASVDAMSPGGMVMPGGMTMPGGMVMPAASPSAAPLGPETTDVPPCVSDPSAPSCKDYQYPPELVEADLDSLCTMMGYMPGCSVRVACRLGTVHGAYCSPFAVLASICLEMPRMAGCARYNSLCNATTSVVEQCTGADIAGLMSTMDAKDAVFTICGSAEAKDLMPCTTCTALECPNPLTALSKLCTSQPDQPACSKFADMCAVVTTWPPAKADNSSSFAAFCPAPASGSGSSTMSPSGTMMHGGMVMPAASPSAAPLGPEATDVPPCVANPSAPTCKDYQYPTAYAQADNDNLCNAMPYMPGCHVRMQCMMGNVRGPYCAPFTVLASICADMPRMAGCRRYNSLCNATTSVVEQCKALPAIPSMPTTMAAWDAINTLCETSEAQVLPQCTRCTKLACPSPLHALSMACYAQPNHAGCALVKRFCTAATEWAPAKADRTSTLAAYCNPGSLPRLPSPAPVPVPVPAPAPMDQHVSPSPSPSPSTLAQKPSSSPLPSMPPKPSASTSKKPSPSPSLTKKPSPSPSKQPSTTKKPSSDKKPSPRKVIVVKP